jgi:predicted ribosomally synthesized peptide with SipW-like signal peptide
MKKIGILALALIVALSAIGMGYAWWTQSLTINGTVNTGSLKVAFTGVYPNPDGYGVATCDPGFTGDTLTINIDNAYPGYYNILNYSIANHGTIPAYVHLESIKYYQVISGVPTEITDDPNCPIYIDNIYPFTYPLNNYYDNGTVNEDYSNGAAFPAGDEETYECDFGVHELADNTSQGQQYQIVISLTAHQFNEPTSNYVK